MVRQWAVTDCVLGLALFLSSCEYVITIQGTAINLSPPVLLETKVCNGTNDWVNITGNVKIHYDRMRNRYSGCTYVDGNLEITHLKGDPNDFDLSFLSDIRVVRGYVLIAVLEIPNVVLPHLVLIKAEKTVEFKQKQYGLLVFANRHLESVQMPALKEMSNGDVWMTDNPMLCYVDTIAWDVITTGNVTIIHTLESCNCTDCSAECTGKSGARHCWAPGPNNCQKVERRKCASMCPGRCYRESEWMQGCCHPQCAAGCTGARNTECTECRNVRHRGQCLPFCPQGTYPRAGGECEYC